ncbi:16S rRNA (guanine(1405)-N(7))-methyltransferase ArmA [candidate division WWE3 bacterium CG10_big_fil_rev_8_21_14_0_10_32_10]|uniref:16S rRNA (guanine(1405)-N(7))-methyltransferase n=1 Tax=candidate division WWE3 bacterium CG10_big_fil_rev_8_21_14_0_10_32_10 TaxID=1975090 RepID=A0A2H0RAW1_UNCKA|nr:MAG: 16S rRNA (guanine(1405)-N(7))-methyltransferase ArmA [candidate division WWE3 bacterium CG10_big_fil_rev_8_21_14_0_10_32_10]
MIDETKNILKSKKYKNIYNKTVHRIVGETYKRYRKKDIVNKSKNILHQSWGAFFTKSPNYKELLEKLKGNEDLKNTLLPILKTHQSTKERVFILNDFYKNIFKLTETPHSIIDYGCGFNPLTIPWMNLKEGTVYKAYDIDSEEINFLNKAMLVIMKKSNINIKTKIEVGDIVYKNNEYADIAFLFKIIPPLEKQNIDILKTLEGINAKHLVVSYSTKSISGKNKGMENFYKERFLKLVQNTNWSVKEINFKTELVFVIKK